MIRTRKTKELGEILALLHLDSFTLRQKKINQCGVFVIPQDVSRDL